MEEVWVFLAVLMFPHPRGVRAEPVVPPFP